MAIWRLEGVSQAGMARRLGRSSSTVNCELARNRPPSAGYQSSFAEGSCLARRERLALLERDERHERFVVDRLAEPGSTGLLLLLGVLPLRTVGEPVGRGLSAVV